LSWRRPGPAGRQPPGSASTLARSRLLGDNAGMARDDSRAQWLWRLYVPVLDGARPSGVLGWVSPVAPVVAQAVVGAGHWAAGRRQRALAAWAGAVGYGLVAWGLGTEAPTQAEDRRRVGPGRSRIGSPAAGSIG
jgi:hypothetical protein